MVFCGLEDRGFTESPGSNKKELRTLLDALNERRYFLFPVSQLVSASLAAIFNSKGFIIALLHSTKMCNAEMRNTRWVCDVTVMILVFPFFVP